MLVLTVVVISKACDNCGQKIEILDGKPLDYHAGSYHRCRQGECIAMAKSLPEERTVERKPTTAIIEPKIADWNSFLYHTGCKRLLLIHSFMMMLKQNHGTSLFLQSYGLRATKEMGHEDIDLTGACKICGQDHSAVTIELEHGIFIMTPKSYQATYCHQTFSGQKRRDSRKWC